ncbi:MAG: tyrosine-type recombinase/integrase [Hydrogenobacter sp.]
MWEYLIDKYLGSLRGRASKTIKDKAYRLSFLLDYGESFDVRGFFDYLVSRGLSYSTIRLVFQEVRSFFSWAKVEFDEESYRELWKGQRVRTKLRREIEYFTQDQAQKILDCISGRGQCSPKHPIWFLFTLVLLYSGLRVSEALSLRGEDLVVKRVIDDDGNEREFLFLKVREGKFGKSREVPMGLLPDRYKETIKKLFSKEDPWVYEIKYPKSVKKRRLNLASVERFYYDLSKEIGFKVRPHLFRYTYAVWLSSQGVPLEFVQDWLGHESPSMTLKAYLKARKEKEIEVLLRID